MPGELSDRRIARAHGWIAAAILAGLCAVALAPGAASASDAVVPYTTKSASRGDVTAHLAYRAGPDEKNPDTRLRIERAGAVVFDGPVTHPRYRRADLPPIPAGGDLAESRPLKVVDLDRGGGTEVIVDLYTRGAHCCWESLIYRERSGAFRPVFQGWGSQSYRLTDLGRDGRREFLSADDRFSYEFCSFAASARPTQIWRYRGGKLRDVTRSFSARTAKETRSLWRRYLLLRKSDRCAARSWLAAWTADKFLLRQGRTAMRTVERQRRLGHLRPQAKFDTFPAGKRYVKALRRFLKRTRYIR